MNRSPALLALAALIAACSGDAAPATPPADAAPPGPPPERYDVLVRGGTVYDGSGKPGLVGDVAIRGDSIVAVGAAVPRGSTGATEIDAKGLAVAPGFIDVLSQSDRSLIQDGHERSSKRIPRFAS